jgi:hypothetical protein
VFFWYESDLLTVLLFAGGFQCQQSAGLARLTVDAFNTLVKKLVDLQWYSSKVAVLCSRGS